MTYEKLKTALLTNRFFVKDGGFSKTAVILSVTWAFVLFKYLFATCVFAVTILGYKFLWPIIFNWADAGAITGAASSLYFAVHNLRKDVNKADIPPLAAAATQVEVNIKDSKDLTDRNK